MPITTTEDELVELEYRFWQALKDGDVETATELSDFPVILSGAQGVSKIDRATFTAMMERSSYTIDRFELLDPEVRFVRPDVAVLAYKVREQLTVDGQPVVVDAADSSTWIRRDGRWACAQHSEAVVGDPFGRDRRATA